MQGINRDLYELLAHMLDISSSRVIGMKVDNDFISALQIVDQILFF